MTTYTDAITGQVHKQSHHYLIAVLLCEIHIKHRVRKNIVRIEKKIIPFFLRFDIVDNLDLLCVFINGSVTKQEVAIIGHRSYQTTPQCRIRISRTLLCEQYRVVLWCYFGIILVLFRCYFDRHGNCYCCRGSAE